MNETPEMFLKNSIERILADPATKKKENAALKKACESALEQLNAEIESNCKQGLVSSPRHDILPNSEDFILADSYFLPFELACQSKSSKIVITALDSIQKLINHKNLVGDSPDSTNPEHLLIDRIVQSVCHPFQGPQTDEAIQLQIITTILTIILRSQTNQATARGVLTQTIDCVFTNMERQETGSDSDVDGLDLDEAAVRGTMDSIVNQIAASDAADSNKKAKNGSLNEDVRSSRRSSMEGVVEVEHPWH
uniref:Mon2/Sec7/BIG1-like dimerisation and cyclophilin-binding domain-containing protein n=1 Tax=Ditylenchus dipsaci TaxID=166011 RepID=A0A915ESK1_9BILA